ncbi:ankyrin repeat domain-containing protein [Franconibacter daqui]|uniref:ankyrin repeat domain-containing protein n=1 Tax=Franconibacter daqui TaxID=2047724 RepID=UPI002DBC9823|nr:ankyrin repeat domain-containing protein [Franconibacter daqui]MEB5922594.1 ankyrin repeat domain-containing protein [Franconibacter daqui]
MISKTKKMMRIIATAALVSISFITGCNAMKKYPAEDFFSGSQLTLAQAIERGNINEVKELSSQTNLNKPGAQDMTLLFFAVQSAYDKEPDRLKIMSVLVKAGADPAQQIPDMGSVAEMVVKSDSPSFVNALLEGGMNPNLVVGSTPIIFGAASDHSRAVLESLIRHGADINKRDSLQQTALIEALAGQQLDTVIWMLEHGADPSVTTKNGWQFSHMLEHTMSLHPDGEARLKLEQIRRIAVNKGMKWPPVPR